MDPGSLAQIGYWQDDVLSVDLGTSVQVQTPVIVSPARFILGSSDVLCFAQQSRLVFHLAQPRLLGPSVCVDRCLHFRGVGGDKISRRESEAPLRQGHGKEESDGQQRKEPEGKVEEGL